MVLRKVEQVMVSECSPLSLLHRAHPWITRVKWLPTDGCPKLYCFPSEQHKSPLAMAMSRDSSWLSLGNLAWFKYSDSGEGFLVPHLPEAGSLEFMSRLPGVASRSSWKPLWNRTGRESGCASHFPSQSKQFLVCTDMYVHGVCSYICAVALGVIPQELPTLSFYVSFVPTWSLSSPVGWLASKSQGPFHLYLTRTTQLTFSPYHITQWASSSQSSD